MRRSRCAVADDDYIRIHRLQVACRVDECFSLDHGTGGGGNVDGVGAESLGGYFK